MEKISQVIGYNAEVNPINPIIIKQKSNQLPLERDEAYWQARYTDLLERYSKLTKNYFKGIACRREQLQLQRYEVLSSMFRIKLVMT